MNDKGIRLLSWAASYGQLGAVELLLDKGADIDHCDHLGRNALTVAAEKGYLTIIKALRTHKAKLDLRDKEGKTALHWAVAHADVTAFLIQEEPKLLTIVDREGKDALQRAAGEGHLASVRLLIQAANSVHRKDLQGRTAFWWAAAEGHVEVCKALESAGADINTQDKQEQAAISWAAHKNREAVVRYLLERNVNLKTKDYLGKGPLHWAVEYPVLVKLFLDQGIDPNVRDNKQGTPLTWAAYFGAHESVNLLLERGANPSLRDMDGKSAANLAASNGHDEIVQTLANTQQVAQDDLIESFHRAAYNGNVPVLKTILTQGVGVNCRLENGKTALNWAAGNSQVDAVRFLLSKKARVDIADSQGQTPLAWAAHADCAEVVALLLDRFADSQSVDQLGKTPLHWAKSKKVAELLIKAGALVNAQDKEGKTALSWACYEGRLDLARYLITRKAQINLCDELGCSPLYWAAGHPDLVDMLVSHKETNLRCHDKEGLNALHCAVIHGQIRSVKTLVDAGLDPEETTIDGRTPLMLAVQRHDHVLVDFFINNKKVAVDSLDSAGRNLLHIGAYTGNYRFLRTAPQDTWCAVNDQCNAKGRTPLQWALRMTKGAVKKEGDQIPVSVAAAIIAELVLHGADSRKKDFKGNAAQHYCELNFSCRKEQQLCILVLRYHELSAHEKKECHALFRELFQRDLSSAQGAQNTREETLLNNLQDSSLFNT
jgi:ankyrin repeat protein